jgi:hypothetical protein
MKTQTLSHPSMSIFALQPDQSKIMADLHILTGLVREDSPTRIHEIDPSALAQYLLRGSENAVDEDFVVLTNNFSQRKSFMIDSLLPRVSPKQLNSTYHHEDRLPSLGQQSF